MGGTNSLQTLLQTQAQHEAEKQQGDGDIRDLAFKSAGLLLQAAPMAIGALFGGGAGAAAGQAAGGALASSAMPATPAVANNQFAQQLAQLKLRPRFGGFR